jgi:hypothetical protein
MSQGRSQQKQAARGAYVTLGKLHLYKADLIMAVNG